MSRFTLYTMLLGVLLVFPRYSAARCVDATMLDSREERHLRRYWSHLGIPQLTSPQRNSTCAQVVRELHRDPGHRSLSPWMYYVNKDDNRFPRDISFATCLCDGCIIEDGEDRSYNSRPVIIKLMVLRKTSCPGDPSRYMVWKDFINVPVACTCVRPDVNHIY